MHCLDGWRLAYDDYSDSYEEGEETVFTLTNGYIGVRATRELTSPNAIGGAYIAGLYDKPDKYEKVERFGLIMVNKALCPSYAILPTFWGVRVYTDNESFDFCTSKVVKYNRVLDMKHATLTNEYVLESSFGKQISLTFTSIVSKVQLHIFATKLVVKALNFSGNVRVCFDYSQDDKPILIQRIMDYNCPTAFVSAEEENGQVVLCSKVTETNIDIVLSAKTTGVGKKNFVQIVNGISEVFDINAVQGEKYEFHKIVAINTSKESNNPIENAKKLLAKAENCGFTALAEENSAFWAKKWEIADVEIGGEATLQPILRWNIFSLIGLGIEDGTDASISATGLHGLGYFGHIFWDTEVFMLPFYTATAPEIAKTLLTYRYNRLNAARTFAKENGYIGAQYPWTTTDGGHNVCPIDWARVGDRELHITSDVAYGFHDYYTRTGDKQFYDNYGVEVIVETAKYWTSKVTKGEDGNYHLLDVIGPDEYNIHADDNYFTNFGAKWNVALAIGEMARLKKENKAQYDKLNAITEYEKYEAQLKDVAEKLYLLPTVDNVCEQYDGFFKLDPMPEIERDEFNMPITRVQAYGKSYQILKQPDVVMIHFMFPNEFSEEVKRASYNYYSKCCIHGSSLSPSIHSIVGLRLGYNDVAYGYFRQSTYIDCMNLHMDKSIKDGIHAACIGGTWATTTLGFGGVCVENGELVFRPVLPNKIEYCNFKYIHKGQLVKCNVSLQEFTVTNLSDKPLQFSYYTEKCELAVGESKTFVMKA